MSDIYKNREPMPTGGNNPPKARRKRRSASARAFDDHDRKRRSKNKGLRRFLHLSRKSDNEKYFWGTAGVVLIVLLGIIAFWQFVIVDGQARTKETKSKSIEYRTSTPEADNSASK